MSKLSRTKAYWELLPTDPFILKNRLKNLSKTFEMIFSKGYWTAKISPRIDGHKIEITEISVDHNEAMNRLDTKIERLGLYGKD